MTTQQTIIHFIETELLDANDAAQLSPQDNLLMSDIIDSLGIMQLVAFVEEQFAIDVPPQDITIEHFVNVEKIAHYVEAQLV